ncbi:snapalysin family zinc-dependent metalloprotease [Streptomyces sp. A3M-1-3]|uniref:snapalysin family zinc-dependent metalloprotease n=1 Tax=Streptomyces sp. A3M-1-3 TaxID=2962044 RepID=UPI0027E51725|nr:snapalysin family zinc-dependent metalloprotease [Streptomyces sp. A3M-1-3]
MRAYCNARNAPSFRTQIARRTQIWNSSVANQQERARVAYLWRNGIAAATS